MQVHGYLDIQYSVPFLSMVRGPISTYTSELYIRRKCLATDRATGTTCLHNKACRCLSEATRHYHPWQVGWGYAWNQPGASSTTCREREVTGRQISGTHSVGDEDKNGKSPPSREPLCHANHLACYVDHCRKTLAVRRRLKDVFNFEVDVAPGGRWFCLRPWDSFSQVLKSTPARR